MQEDAPLCTGFGRTAPGASSAGVLRGARGRAGPTGSTAARASRARATRRSGCARESGRALDADLVVMGTGAMPDVMLARAAGLELGETGGVACSVAAGDLRGGRVGGRRRCEYDSVVHGRRLRIEHWEVARAQGQAVARALAGRPGRLHRGARTSGPTSPTGHARVRRPGERVGPRGRARLGRRRRVHDLLPRRRPAGGRPHRRAPGRPRPRTAPARRAYRPRRPRGCARRRGDRPRRL